MNSTKIIMSNILYQYLPYKSEKKKEKEDYIAMRTWYARYWKRKYQSVPIYIYIYVEFNNEFENINNENSCNVKMMSYYI